MKQLLNDFLFQGHYLYRAVLLTVPLLLSFLYLREHGLRGTAGKLLRLLKRPWLIAFVLYLSLILTAAVFARLRTDPTRVILTHFWFRPGDSHWNNEIIENLAFFVPYTMLGLLAFRPKRPALFSFLLAFCTSAFVEVSQLISWVGEFQLSDLLHNVLGGLAGYGLWRAGAALRARIRRRSGEPLRYRAGRAVRDAIDRYYERKRHGREETEQTQKTRPEDRPGVR